MNPQAPVWRGNWSLFNDLDSPLDLYSPEGHTDRNEHNTTTRYRGHMTGRELLFRAEYQTLRKYLNKRCRTVRCRTETFRKSLRFPGGKLFNELGSSTTSDVLTT